VAGFEEATNQIVEATRAAAQAADSDLVYFDAACFGLAGTGRDADRERMEELLGAQTLAAECAVDHDAAVALHGAMGGRPGVIALAGTGAISFGVDAEGRRARADGWGRLMGDEGGGYDLGVQALRAAARGLEGRGPVTSLSDRVFAATATSDLDQLASWLYDGYRGADEIAAFARCVVDAADDGDEVATGLIESAANSLARAAGAVLRELWADGDSVAVSYGGSLLNRDSCLQQAFVAAARDLVPNADIRPPRHEPAVGAGLRALELLRDGNGEAR